MNPWWRKPPNYPLGYLPMVPWTPSTNQFMPTSSASARIASGSHLETGTVHGCHVLEDIEKTGFHFFLGRSGIDRNADSKRAAKKKEP
jgi:hypothetical protein